MDGRGLIRSSMPSNPEHLIFDFDGTLVDSIRGIQQSTEVAMEKLHPGRPFPDVRKHIGPPLPIMFAKIFPDLDPREIQQLVLAFREAYENSGWSNAPLFEGVKATLEMLHESGAYLSILTNKPLRFVSRILAMHGVDHLISEVAAADSPGLSFSTKPEGGVALFERRQIHPPDALLVGDSEDDLQTAEACGCKFLAAAYGYGSAHLQTRNVLEKFADIKRFLI